MYFCWYCMEECKELNKICKSESDTNAHSFACPECVEIVQELRLCHSEKHTCQEKLTCHQCKEEYHPCRAVRVWSANLEDKGRKIIRGNMGVYFDSLYTGENQILIVCALCARAPGITHSWVCKPDYLEDHSRAKCSFCNQIDFKSSMNYGRGPCCS